jgi:D-alanyl-D-alanine carboxypeptidase
MKIKSLTLILAGFLFMGLPVLKAEGPVVTCHDDSAKVGIAALVTPSSIQQLSPVPVNEAEIKAGLLYDVVNQKIVWQKNMTNAYPIASLTKMMVAFLTVEDVKAGKFSWTDNVSWTRETVFGRRSHRKKIYTEVSYSLRDVFKAAMIASNNECAEQMARYIGNGDLQSTIDRMNSRAKELGMMTTYYGNPTGLPAPHTMFDNSSTPSDLLLLTMEMLKYPEVLEISAMGYAAIENGKKSSVIRNHNSLTIEYSGEVDGLKTGYTKRAGFCLVATTAKCDHRLVSIVLGCRGPAIRNEIVRDMVNDYYSSIGLDRLGPFCPSPVNPDNNLQANANGKYVTIYEPVKKVHIVGRGETISSIAMNYKCTTRQLKSWNYRALRNNRAVKGQRLVVMVQQPKNIFIQNPVNGNEAEDDQPLMSSSEKEELNRAEKQEEENAPAVEKPVTKPAAKYFYHTVAPGDTLFNIAKRYEGVSVEELKSLNKISDSRALKPGTKLKVKVHG